MSDPTRPGSLPPASPGGPRAGSGASGVSAPNPIHLPPQNWIQGGPAPTEQARAYASTGTLSTVGGNIATAQTTLQSAAGKYVPVSYGPNRWSGYTYFWMVRPSTGAHIIGQLLCEGEIDGMIGAEIDNQPLRSGVAMNSYVGTASQAVDPLIIACLAEIGVTYTDALPGLAHVVLSIPATAYGANELRGIDIEYRGKKVFDSRDNTQVETNTATWKYSNRSALVLTDFLTSGRAIARNVLPRYGRRLKVREASVVAAANFNEELIGDVPNQSVRSEVGFTLLEPTSNEQVEQMLRTHAMCHVDRLGDTVELIPDVARASVMTIDETQILRYERVGDRKLQAAPTAITVNYTNTSVKPWRSESLTLYDPRVRTGELPEIPGTVELRACQSRRQALGIGLRRLQTEMLSTRAWGFSVGAFGMQLQKADRVQVTHPIGFTNKAFTIDTATDVGFGEFYAKVSEYDANMFSPVIQTEPQALGSGASNCGTVPAVGTVTVTQRSVNELQSGGSYACILRARATWPATSFACHDGYDVETLSGLTVIHSTAVGSPEYVSPALSAGTYSVRARVRSSVPGQLPGAWSSTNITIAAATCPPVPTQRAWAYGSNGLRFDSTFAWNQFVRQIRCNAPLTTITRTQLWFAWSDSATFGSASLVRDDAGAQTQWTFWRGRRSNNGANANAATVALGLTPDLAAGAGTANALGSATSGTYANRLTGYTGPSGEWFPPAKIWVRFENAGVFSDPVEIVVSQWQTVMTVNETYVYTFDGTVFVPAGTVSTQTYNTDQSVPYVTHRAVRGSHLYRHITTTISHEVKSQAKDAYGDLVSGYAQFQYWRV